MAEILRLNVWSDWLNVDFVERNRTPSQLMTLGIRCILRVYRSRIPSLSLNITVSNAVNDWIRKADPQPSSGETPIRSRSTKQ